MGAHGHAGLAYASFIGGSQWEQPREIIPCADGTILIGGQTSSPDLPVTAGAAQPKPGGRHDGVILKLVPRQRRKKP